MTDYYKVRLAGGGCIIALENDPSNNIGLAVATTVLLNVGGWFNIL